MDRHSQQLSPAVQDYLRAIQALSSSDGRRVSTSALAECLDIQPASVTAMLQRMATLDPPLVDYQKREGVILSAAGRQAAERLTRNFRILSQYLQLVLGYSGSEAGCEADQLEHAVRPEVIDRMALLIGRPETPQLPLQELEQTQ